MPRKRVAIVSSYKVTCGIAYNAERVEHHLKPYYDVEVLPVDMELTRNIYSKNARKAADRHIADIAGRLKEFDAINIQFEGGIFGSLYIHTWPRVCKLLKNARSHVILTMHCGPFPEEIGKKEVIRSLRKYLIFSPFFLAYRVWHKIQCQHFWNLARTMARRGQLTMIVYNKRERDRIANYQDMPRVVDHPLCYFSQAERDAIHANNPGYWRNRFGLQDSDVIIGVFGFVAPYKGFVDVIRALVYLPDHYKLVIFGGANITVIKSREECDPYLNSLIQLVKALKLEKRVIFSGTLTDDQICQSTAQADIVILPYAETDQVASGPGTLAIELADKIIVSDTYIFNRYRDYFPGRMHKYDTGNVLQLAQAILQAHSEPRQKPPYLPLNIESQTKLYCDIWDGHFQMDSKK